MNEKAQGVAFVNVDLPDGEVLFPTVAVKNCKVDALSIIINFLFGLVVLLSIDFRFATVLLSGWFQ